MNSSTTVFVARIGNRREKGLRYLCGYYGEIMEVTLLSDGEKKKACGFVKFKRVEDAIRCVCDAKEKKGIFAENNKVIIEWAKSSQIKESDLDKTTLYITGMSKCDESFIKSKMETYGLIQKITIPRGEQTYAFVKFANESDASKAKDAENGKEWNGKRVVIEFSEAQTSKRNRRQKATMKRFAQFFGAISSPASPGLEYCSTDESGSQEEYDSCDDCLLTQKEEDESDNIISGSIDWNILANHYGTPALWESDEEELPIFASLRQKEEKINLPLCIESILY
ncbi:hypothetical protein ENUP19_0071G0019 [Entamoeba nuttalli]|uniref:RNA recognition motif domain containing protein n=2 Tax=Entamoeba nuttalli TaxID=412467 RepID=K2HWQ4_ENTNP|nr:RNA recognition motif domain containing protein [Entamoeba nuttalli P19]EKE40655.1 RNA recognition motif domain containing protein [Entamoeba nuttalli P19]|eukprot:XP_008857011.1 RNA recognition motif domain containing protein [Entamoeba nuttalli P19]